MAVQHEQLFRNWTTRRQLVVSWSLIATVATVHILLPSARPSTRLFYELSYHKGEGNYVQGSNDAFFVAGWLVLMTAIRATIIASIYQFVTQLALMSGQARIRFAEQSFLLIYYVISFSVGMHLLMESSYWLNFAELWSSWPSRKISGQLKWYYLVQLSFYLQQVAAVNFEKRRKDYAQMFTHHVVTSSLMFIAYAYRWTNIGHVILVIMDSVDFLLPLAKMLKYLHYEVACTAMFVAFLATWLVARHGIYVSLCWSIYRDVPGVMSYGCYSGATEELETDPNRLGSWRYAEPFFDQTGTICLDRSVKWVFLGLLLMLQVLSMVWFVMIIKVALGMLNGGEANDTRSGDEDEEEEKECKAPRPTAKTNGTVCAGKARASGSDAAPPRQNGYFQRGGGRIRVPGSRDRKELIGRVGCNG